MTDVVLIMTKTTDDLKTKAADAMIAYAKSYLADLYVKYDVKRCDSLRVYLNESDGTYRVVADGDDENIDLVCEDMYTNLMWYRDPFLALALVLYCTGQRVALYDLIG